MESLHLLLAAQSRYDGAADELAGRMLETGEAVGGLFDGVPVWLVVALLGLFFGISAMAAANKDDDKNETK